MINYLRLLSIALVATCLTACGGGGGGSSAPPPQPSVTVSGNAGTYWQDDTISISFSVRNMDTSTVSYAVTGSLGNNNFVVDSSAGTFRTVDDDWTESGSYSLTVTATDGGGKTASRAFQFTVDTVMTGYYEVCDPIQGCVEEGGRSVFIEATRDGIFSAGFWNYDGTDWDSSDLTVHAFTCYGSLSVDGVSVNGSASCDGKYPQTPYSYQNSFTDYREVDRIEITTDLSQGLEGALSFYDPTGALIETWDGSAGEYIERDYSWPTNTELRGRYAIIGIEYQYEHTTAINVWNGFFNTYRQDWLPFLWHAFLDDDANFLAGTPTFEVDANHNIVAGPSVGTGESSCSISGAFSSLALGEYASTTNIPTNPWRYGARTMSANYSATGCDTLVSSIVPITLIFTGQEIDPPLSINQSSGQVIVDPYLRSYYPNGFYAGNEWTLAISGPGDTGPFIFYAGKVCDSDGTPTLINSSGQIDCQTGESKAHFSTSSSKVLSLKRRGTEASPYSLRKNGAPALPIHRHR